LSFDLVVLREGNTLHAGFALELSFDLGFGLLLLDKDPGVLLPQPNAFISLLVVFDKDLHDILREGLLSLAVLGLFFLRGNDTALRVLTPVFLFTFLPFSQDGFSLL